MTYPSHGCQTCKARRIKCDEGYPTCQKCVKSHRVCKRLSPESASLIVHAENVYASRQTKRPRGPRKLSKASVSIYQKPEFQLTPCDLKAQAISFYVSRHVRPESESGDFSISMTDEFAPMWKSKSNISMLHYAFSSLALAIFSRTQKYPAATVEATAEYQQVLTVAQSTLNFVTPKSFDDILLALFFMCRYEDAIHRPYSSQQANSFEALLYGSPHRDGALAVLKLWLEHPNRDEPTTVVKHTRRGLIRTALMKREQVPQWMLDGAEFGERGAELEFDRLLVRITALCCYSTIILRDGATTGAEILNGINELDSEAQDIDRCLKVWKKRLPASWHPQKLTISDLCSFPQLHFYSGAVHNFRNPAHGAFWAHYLSLRMLVNNTRLQLFSYHPFLDCARGEQEKCLVEMNSLADELASSVPYHLGAFQIDLNGDTSTAAAVRKGSADAKPYSASLVTWPLTIATSLKHLDVEYKAWFRAELVYIAELVGVGVLEFAGTDDWLAL